MKRGTAESILDSLRVLLAQRQAPDRIEAFLDKQHGIPPLARCDGAGHDNELGTDHCLVCAPRWGWVGERIKIT